MVLYWSCGFITFHKKKLILSVLRINTICLIFNHSVSHQTLYCRFWKFTGEQAKQQQRALKQCYSKWVWSTFFLNTLQRGRYKNQVPRNSQNKVVFDNNCMLNFIKIEVCILCIFLNFIFLVIHFCCLYQGTDSQTSFLLQCLKKITSRGSRKAVRVGEVELHFATKIHAKITCITHQEVLAPKLEGWCQWPKRKPLSR